MKPIRLITCLAACLILPNLHSQVILQDTYAPTPVGNNANQTPGGAPTQLDNGAGPFGYEIDISTADFSAAGHGKLVMVYSSKDEVGGDFGGAQVNRISYGGVDLNTAISYTNAGNRVTVGIYYLDNVTADGTLRIELADGGQSEYGFGLYALDGLEAGVSNTAGVGGSGDVVSGAAVTVTTNSGFVVQEAARNNQSLAADAEDDYETLYSFAGPQSYVGLSQYQVTTAPGSYFAPINNTGQFKHILGAAFDASAVAIVDPEITSLTQIGGNLWELSLTGTPESDYQFYSSNTLNFNSGTLLENLTQGDLGDAGTVGGDSDSIATTDANGTAVLRVTLTGSSSDFLRAQTAP